MACTTAAVPLPTLRNVTWISMRPVSTTAVWARKVRAARPVSARLPAVPKRTVTMGAASPAAVLVTSRSLPTQTLTVSSSVVPSADSETRFWYGVHYPASPVMFLV